MKSYTLFGNCQAAAMRWVLRGCKPFIDAYELVDIPASYQMEEEDVKHFCEETLPSLDLLFMQPHSAKRSHWHNHETISTLAEAAGVKVIKFPQIYWNGYNPFETQIAAIGNGIRDELTYTDTLVMSAALNGLSFDRFKDQLNDTHDQMMQISALALAAANESMMQVEVGRKCDFPVTDFFNANFKQTRLMHNNNHPTGTTMNLLCNRLLFTLDRSWTSEASPDLFPNHDSIIYGSTASELNLMFKSTDEDIHNRLESYVLFVSGLEADKIASVRSEVETRLRHLGL